MDRPYSNQQEEMRRPTKTQEEQWRVESQVFKIYKDFRELPPHSLSINLEIRREDHIEYLIKSLKQLTSGFSVLDANRPWLCYWIIHSISLLGDSADDALENDIIDFLHRCQDSNGGYGGGPGQMPHLATTYAAVNTLVDLGGHRALSSINREKLYAFFLRMKDASGGFRMHDGGEVDVRACYTAISVASILNILDDRLIQNVGDYILSCQTYEGGIAGEPGSEAHGGYTFCGLAAMVLINEVNRLDLPALIHLRFLLLILLQKRPSATKVNWLVFRQGIECGFQGRTNKLVDGCYSFWQGGVAAIMQRLHLIVNKQLGLSDVIQSDCCTESDHGSTNSDLSEEDQNFEGTSVSANKSQDFPTASPSMDVNHVGYNFIRGPIGMRPLFNSIALQQYILLCTQEEAGFRDKPGKRRDHYHTCYVLSGLSVCQYSGIDDVDSPPLPRDVLGPYSNLLEPVHPLYNVLLDQFYEAHQFFTKS